ncbi:glycosyltransferase family 31 protein [Trichoderma novae-zelandiae]
MLSRRATALITILGVILGAFVLISERSKAPRIDGIYCRGVDQAKERPIVHGDGETTSGGDKGRAPVSIGIASAVLPKDSATRKTSTGTKGRVELECTQFPDTSRILLVMKTGASEAFSKIPTQILTNLKCLPEFLIFGDMEQEIAGYKIHDSLDRVLDSVKTSNGDFNLYVRQRQCAVDQDNCNKDWGVADEGWDLDKYKNIHMAEKAFEMRPDYDWYLFVDADTYVVWPTIVQWLCQLDHTEQMYFGSMAMLDGFPFGHGGSGYVVSSAAMRSFFGCGQVANGWDEAIKNECCGDVVFAKAMKEAIGIEVNNTWPTINGEKPFTIPYSEEEWCQPITTMHHVGSEELSRLYAFERERNFAFPMRIKDLYHQFVAPQLVPIRPDWDNMSDDVFYLDMSSSSDLLDEEQLSRVKTEELSGLEMMAHLSFDSCRAACQADDECLQYRFHDGICGFGRRIIHGQPKSKEDHILQRWMSGWDVDKIEAWVQEHNSCDENIDWPLVQTPRT